MRALVFAVLLATTASLAQNQAAPPAYQPIRVKFRVLDLDGRPLENATIAARLDSSSSRLPPDKVLKGKSGADEFTYVMGDQSAPIFSTQQQVSPEGFAEVPFIVYSNRNDAIDYELDALYKEPNRSVLVSADVHKAFSASDDNTVVELRTNVRRDVPVSSWLIASLALIGLTIMGFLLFFRGMYRYWLSCGKSVEQSRADCWSGTLAVFLVALFGIYFWMLPHVFGMWVFVSLLVVIFGLQLVVSKLTLKRRAH